MNEEPLSELPNEGAALLELGFALGQNHAFGLIAGRCSAAQAEGIRRLREEKLYKRCCEKWIDFCPKYLKMSRTEADRIIKLLEEFGPAYFELSQLTRISAETFRAIAPAIREGALHHDGEAIALNAENSRKIAAAVAEMRGALPKRSGPLSEIEREIMGCCHEGDVQQRFDRLVNCGFSMVNEFERILRDRRLGITRMYFRDSLGHLRDEMERLVEQASGAA